MRQLPVHDALLDARFYFQILGGHCATADYIQLTDRLDQIENLAADTPLHGRERYRQAMAVHRLIVAAVRRHTGY